MELYLRWLEKYEMQEDEETPMGLILCTEDDSLTIIRRLKESGVECCFEKKDFYTGKVPKNAVKWAFFGTFWCLGGV